MTLWQDPKHVRTKFRKGIVTAFITAPIPSAATIFMDYYVYARDVLGFPRMILYFLKPWLFRTLKL